MALHILHVISSLSPADGGPPEAVRQLVKAYKEIGFSIEVVCLDKPDKEFLGTVPCPVHALGSSFLGRYSLSPRLWSWLFYNAHRFDTIIVNGIWTFPCIAVRASARRSKKPYGILVHGALDPYFNREYPLKHVKKMLYWPMQYAVLRDASAVLFTSTLERDLARTSFSPNNWRSVVVPYGIGDPELNEYGATDRVAQMRTFYERLPSLHERRFLLFLGRIHEKKGMRSIAASFFKVCIRSTERGSGRSRSGPSGNAVEASTTEPATRYRAKDPLARTAQRRPKVGSSALL
jgi:glycosyltransferase involved in cell wall biosynthesis